MARAAILVLVGVCAFAIVAVAMTRVMPAPVKDSDYLIVGSVATLVALLAVFLTLIWMTKSANVFFKKRRK